MGTRNTEQAEAMEDKGIEYDHVINLVVSEEEVIKRLTSRGRADDKPEIIKNRIKVYHRETAPLLTYYKDEIINIKAEGSTPELITKEIIKTNVASFFLSKNKIQPRAPPNTANAKAAVTQAGTLS